MEFGFEPVCDQVRAISTCRDSSNLLEPGCRPVRSQIPLRYPGRKPGRRPAASWNLACHALSSSLAGLRQVWDQPRTCLRPGYRNEIWLLQANVAQLQRAKFVRRCLVRQCPVHYCPVYQCPILQWAVLQFQRPRHYLRI